MDERKLLWRTKKVINLGTKKIVSTQKVDPIDEYGRIKERIAELTVSLKDLGKQIQEEENLEVGVTLGGGEFVITKREKTTRTLSVKKVLNLLGADKLMEVVGVSATKAKQLLSLEQLDKCVDSTKTSTYLDCKKRKG